jgi:hypothetical protein
VGGGGSEGGSDKRLLVFTDRSTRCAGTMMIMMSKRDSADTDSGTSLPVNFLCGGTDFGLVSFKRDGSPGPCYGKSKQRLIDELTLTMMMELSVTHNFSSHTHLPHRHPMIRLSAPSHIRQPGSTMLVPNTGTSNRPTPPPPMATCHKNCDVGLMPHTLFPHASLCTRPLILLLPLLLLSMQCQVVAAAAAARRRRRRRRRRRWQWQSWQWRWRPCYRHLRGMQWISRYVTHFRCADVCARAQLASPSRKAFPQNYHWSLPSQPLVQNARRGESAAPLSRPRAQSACAHRLVHF